MFCQDVLHSWEPAGVQSLQVLQERLSRASARLSRASERLSGASERLGRASERLSGPSERLSKALNACP